jgi:glycosyltransferase involved in cell wall biosynthesis
MASNINVIITCYKEGNLIRRAIESLQKQTDNDFSIILVYDASRDALTEAVCKEFENTKNITVIWNEKNLGLSGARNVGVEKMSGEIIVFLDADDTLPPNTIEIIKKEFKDHPDADFIFGNYFRHNVEKESKEEMDCSVLTTKDGLLSPSKLALAWILIGTSPMKKSFFKKNNGYSIKYSNSCQDVDFWMRALLLEPTPKGYYTNNCIYNWYRSETGMNNSKKNRDDLNTCINSNIDFYIKFDSNTKDLYNYLYKINDIKGIKKRAHQELQKGNRNKLNTLYAFAPHFFIKIISKQLFKNYEY